MFQMPETKLDQEGPVLNCRPGCLAVVIAAALAPNLGRVVKVRRLCNPPPGRRYVDKGFIWEVETPDALLWRVGPAHFSQTVGPVPDLQLQAIHPWPTKRLPPMYMAHWVKKWNLPLPVPVLDNRVATGLAMLGDRLGLHPERGDPMHNCAALNELSLYRLFQQSAEEGEIPCEF